MERIKKVLINSTLSIKDAIKKMDLIGEKTLIIIDDTEKLLGVVTDGDIRRWILKEGDLYAEVSKIMTRKPVCVQENYDLENVKKIMAEKRIECIPVVDNKSILISSIWWYDIFNIKPKKNANIDLPVVIMAGGKGTRLHPFTKILPKPLIPIDEKPIIELIIDNFYQYGCKNYYISVNYKANMIKAYFNDLKPPYKLHYFQEKQPLGTAGSLYLLKDIIKSPFFINNCDILIEADYADILNFHKEQKNVITIISSLKHYSIPYGILEVNTGGALKEIKEKPEYDFFVNTGMYLLEPEVFNDIPEEEFLPITDLINLYLKKKKKVGVYPVSEKSWLDIGQWEELQAVVESFSLKNK